MKKNLLLIIILISGIFLRAYNYKELFMYGHDQDLSAWVVRDILDNHHLRLLGQETSVGGVFIGGLFYYLQIPFYLLFHMDPVGGIFLSLTFSAFSILSIYWVFKKIFGTNAALIGAVIYAISFNIVFTDREVVPTQPVMLWSIWLFYTVWLLLNGKHKQGFILSAILIGLVWHLNLGLLVPLVTLPLAVIFSRKKININYFLNGGIALLIISTPLILFEVRHNFLQTRAVFASLVSKETIAITKAAKFDRVMQLVTKNISNLFGTHFFKILPAYIFYALLLLLAFLILKKLINKKLGIIMYAWIATYIIFFTINSLNLSEYYLNGMAIVWIAIASVGVSALLKTRYKDIAIAMIWLFVIINTFGFFTMPHNKSGYLYKRSLIKFIKDDAAAHAYPCVAVSYITQPGYELGYRYLFRIENMHVNLPKSESPVYTIVFPHSMVDRIDRSFGALGLILPDYKKYSQDEVIKTCSGENSNLTYPLFGYTE